MLEDKIDEVKKKVEELSTGTVGNRILMVAKTQLATMDHTVGSSGMTIKDSNWTRKSFLSPDVNFSIKADIKGRYWSSAARKFTDTSLGGNIGVNSKPQYTRYCDIRIKGRLSGRQDVSLVNTSGYHGMGTYYSGAIDDNARRIYMRFGVPQFNSLTNFFDNMYNPARGLLARTGRMPGMPYLIGQGAGLVAGFMFVPIITTGLIAMKTIDTFFGRSNTKFYTMKPTMHSYWSSVNMISNMVAMNRGIIPRSSVGETGAVQGGNVDYAHFEFLKEFAPDIFTSGMGYDVFAIANRAQRIYNAELKKENNTPIESIDFPDREANGTLSPKSKTIEELVQKYLGVCDFQDKLTEQKGNEIDESVFMKREDGEPKKKDACGWKAFLEAEFDMGGQFLCLHVEDKGSVSESFNNSVKETSLGSGFNSKSGSARDFRFSAAGGNILPGMDIIIGAAAEVIAGSLDSVGLSALAALTGGGFMDIPKHWSDSSANLPRADYNFTLVSPYGNAFSQMQNLIIPLAGLLAGALPLSAGAQSYTSPFLVQLFDRGRVQIQLGIIDSLSITRGVTNMGFDNKGHAMSIEVSFSVIDLSSIAHMPIPMLGMDIFSKETFSEDSPLTDYMAVLGGQSIESQIFDLPKAKLKLLKTGRMLDNLSSAAYWSSKLYEDTNPELLNGLARPIKWFSESFEGNDNVMAGTPSPFN